MINTAVNSRYFEFGNFRLDIANRSLLRSGTDVPITQKSFEILRLLVENHGRILTKQEILDAVWTETFVEEATLTQHIYMVRKALRSDGTNNEYIETVPKYGYRFCEEVTERIHEERRVREPRPVRHSKASVSSTIPVAEFAVTRKPRNGSNVRGKKGLSKTALTLTAFLACTAAVFGFLYVPAISDSGRLSRIDSIAVLPFDQIGEPKDERLTLGLADLVTARLSESESVPVSATSAVSNYSRNGFPSEEIGRKLGVEAILTGTIQRDGERVRINVQLVSVAESVPVWTHSFDSHFSDTFALQDSLSEQIAGKLAEGFESERHQPPAPEAQPDTDGSRAFATRIKSGVHQGDKGK